MDVKPHGRADRARDAFLSWPAEQSLRNSISSSLSPYTMSSLTIKKNNSPKQLAELAVKLKREDKRDTSTDCYERIWVVVDVDDFHDHGEAARICNDNGIELIISNPCFEVWLLDYVKACPSSYTLTPDVESAAAEAKVVGGNRNKYINTELIDKEHLDAAIRNAARHNTTENRQGRNRLAPNHEQEYAPWTDMPKVIETLKSNKQS